MEGVLNSRNVKTLNIEIKTASNANLALITVIPALIPLLVTTARQVTFMIVKLILARAAEKTAMLASLMAHVSTARMALFCHLKENALS